MPGDDVFILDSVAFEVGGRRILEDVTVRIEPARTTAVVGPSGSGKSTLLRLLNRFEEPTAGRILFAGVPLSELDVHQMRRRVGLVAQRPTMLTPTIGQEVRIAAPSLTDAQVRRLLERVALPGVELDHATSTLSGGEQQRLALARCLAVAPDVLLLDEPTSALDGHSAQAVDQIVRELVADGLTVVLVSHDLERAADLADSVIVLAGGRVVERGRPDGIGYLA